MAAINDLISQIQDETLRNRIQEEVSKMAKQKKFGLVFEEHMPESTPLYDMPIKRGCNVMRRDSKDDKSIYVVLKIEGDTVVCVKSEQKDEAVTFELKDIVRVAEFGESIYPYLKPLDSVCNAPDSDLWHTLIEADNYHALQLLEYLYAGKVDCIYIDPPYNTGAKDWKYNNDYVDGADAYRHSKWLSFMQRRLRLAKKLLNPKDSVLIVTIDEKEYLHLGCLLEEMFPEAIMQMISSVISFKGSARKQQFTRLDEYIFILVFGEATIQRLPLSDEWRMNPDDERATHLTWKYLIRSGSAGFRERSPGNFYPVFFTTEGKYHSVGEPLPLGTDRTTVIPPEGTFAVFPVDTQGREHYWNINRDKFLEYKSKGYIKFGRPTKNGVPITFLTSGEIRKVEDGTYKIDGYADDGSIISSNEVRDIMPGTQWRIKSHDATRQGTDLLTKILLGRQFPFPKSLYAVHDAIRFFVAQKTNALILDFFSGSGTTMHAVNLLNAEDGGHRRCIMVTNNEVSAEEAGTLLAQGYQPGDAEWEKLGMFTASESDLDRQLRVADAKMGGCGFHLAYGRKYIDFDNPNAFKVDCILFAFDSECIAELNKYAEKKFHELNDQYRKYIVAKPEKCQKQYSDIVANGDEISKHNFTLPETISAKVEADGIKYTDHLFANADGIAKIKLNGWEQAVLAEEQKREDYVCWLRNPSRQSWSLRMPYEMDGKCKELYPDFIIVRQDPILKYIVDILEPHNPDFKDNLGKAKGLANYAANEPRIGRVQLIRIGKDAAGENRFKRLDLAKGSIRNKVLAAISTDELDHIFDTDGVFED